MAHPKYDKRNVTQGQRAPRGSGRAYNKPAVPSDPSGRMVFTIEDKKAPTQIVHWLPATGVDWKCPHCDVLFRRDEDRKGVPWRAV